MFFTLIKIMPLLLLVIILTSCRTEIPRERTGVPAPVLLEPKHQTDSESKTKKPESQKDSPKLKLAVITIPEPIIVKPHTPEKPSVGLKKSPEQPLHKKSRELVNILVSPTHKTSLFLNDSSFIRKWNILGPFNIKNKNSSSDIIHKPFLPNENKLHQDQKTPESTKWHTIKAEQQKHAGEINLADIFPTLKRGAAYAVTTLYAPGKMDNLTLCTGNDDYIKIWINDTLVHTYNKEPRKGDWDQDIIGGITLKKGNNRVVVKSVNLEGPWRFYFRLMTKDGLPVCSLPKTDIKKQ